MKEVKVSVESLDRVRPPSKEGGEQALGDLLEGHVVVDIPGFDDRQKIRREHILPKQADGEESPERLQRLMDYQSSIVTLAKKHFKAVDLKVKGQAAGGQVIHTTEDLEQFDIAGRVYEAVGFVVMKGVPLGN